MEPISLQSEIYDFKALLIGPNEIGSNFVQVPVIADPYASMVFPL